jgi:regulatory protein
MESSESPPSRAREALAKAVDLLARRPHFRAELTSKLERRGFEPDEVDAALARLDELGYLDERGTAVRWVEGVVEQKSWGPRRVRAELRKRGVDGTEAEELIADAYPTGERPVAERAAERWRGREAEALGRHLARRGFSTGVIIEIVAAHRSREDVSR